MLHELVEVPPGFLGGGLQDEVGAVDFDAVNVRAGVLNSLPIRYATERKMVTRLMS